MSTQDVRPVLRAGALAYVDSTVGLMPCKVLAVRGPSGAPTSDTRADVLLTANRGPWKRGEILRDYWSIHIVPRAAILKRSGGARIGYYEVEADKPLVGFDGSTFAIGDRVELSPGCDLWMRGAKFGQVVGTSLTEGDRVKVELDLIPGRKFCGPANHFRRA